MDEWEAGCQEKGPVEQQTEAPGGGGCEGEDPQGGAEGAGSSCQEDACRGRPSMGEQLTGQTPDDKAMTMSAAARNLTAGGQQGTGPGLHQH